MNQVRKNSVQQNPAHALLGRAWKTFLLFFLLLLGFAWHDAFGLLASLFTGFAAFLFWKAQKQNHESTSVLKNHLLLLSQRDTAQKKQLQQIKRKLQFAKKKSLYFESVFQDNLDPIFSTDSIGFILRFNQAACDLFGYTQEQILGKHVAILFYDTKELERLIEKVQTHHKAHTLEIRGLTRQNHIVYLNLSIASMDPELYSGPYIGFIFNCQNISLRKSLEREIYNRSRDLEKLVKTDSLTGLLNLSQFEQDLHSFVQHSLDNPGKILTLVAMNLHHFRKLNESQGRQAGDQALQQFAESIKFCARNSDPAYRLSEDHFFLILRDADAKQALDVAERIQVLYNVRKHIDNPTTVSFGIATWNGEERARDFFTRAQKTIQKN